MGCGEFGRLGEREATMMEQRTCAQCGNPITVGGPRAECPTCLVRLALRLPRAKVDLTAFEPPTPEELTRQIDGVEVLEQVGQGGMGTVYKARQLRLGRLVALKLLPPEWADDPAFAERFVREAKALAQLNHPHIVAVYDAGAAADSLYILMEFVA